MNDYLNIDWLRESGAEPHWFGLGFIQLKISENRRLHFYPDRPDYRSFVGDEEIHDHRYFFRSKVLLGSISQTIYEVNASDTGNFLMVEDDCKPNSSSPSEPVRVSATPIFTTTNTAGTEYSIDKGVFHTVAAKGAITLLERSTKDVRPYARVVHHHAKPKVCAFSQPKPVDELWEVIAEMLPKRGYHVAQIKKGTLGQATKIREEAEEFLDAVNQNVKVMELVELSDLYGAIDAYITKHHPSLTMADLRKMSEVTARAFRNGSRG